MACGVLCMLLVVHCEWKSCFHSDMLQFGDISTIDIVDEYDEQNIF